MRIIIKHENKDQIEAALKEVNGVASQHCFTTFEELQSAARKFQAAMDDLLLPKSLSKGATVVITSGTKVANAYKYKRTGNQIELTHLGDSIALTHIAKCQLWPNSGGKISSILLSKKQEQEALRRFESKFIVRENLSA